MDSTANVPASYSDEMRLGEVLRALGRAKWSILIFVLAATAAAAIASFLLPKRYSATITISPVNDTNGSFQSGAASSVLAQFSGLASLAGISTSSDSRRSESLAVLQSEELTERYIQENGLLPVLFAGKWNSPARRWISGNSDDVPTLWKGNRFFARKVRTITTDTKTGIVTLTIVWRDPYTAAKWANGLVKLVNSYLQQKAISESEKHVAYLNAEAAKTDVLPVKQAIYALLQSEINREMLARGSEEYAFKVLDPAFPPELPTFPRPTWWILGGLLGSLVLSVLLVFLRVAWDRS